jgi:rubrerythrin
MIEREQLPAEVDGDYVDGDYIVFLQAGDAAKGAFRCAECGYGVVVTAGLPTCPMCGSASWEHSEWSPFRRSSLL